MPRPHISMRKIRDALRLRNDGLSLRDVAASLQMPFTTVGDHLRRAKAAGLGWPLPEGLDDDALEALLFASDGPPADPRPLPDWAKVHVELRRPHVTLMLLWLERKEACPEGYGYSQFCELYRRWQRRIDVVMRQEHKAGEKLLVDFAGRRIPIWDQSTGELAFEAELFVAVLGASGYLFAEALRSQELLHWVTGHVHAFEALGGCPAIVVCDNLRSGVTRPDRYEPDVTHRRPPALLPSAGPRPSRYRPDGHQPRRSIPRSPRPSSNSKRPASSPRRTAASQNRTPLRVRRRVRPGRLSPAVLEPCETGRAWSAIPPGPVTATQACQEADRGRSGRAPQRHRRVERGRRPADPAPSAGTEATSGPE